MRMLLSVVAAAALTLSCDVHQHLHAMMAQDSGPPKSAAAAVAGQWQMSLQTPHGPMKAGLQVKQDGTKINGTCDTDHMGSLALTGTVDGKRDLVHHRNSGRTEDHLLRHRRGEQQDERELRPRRWRVERHPYMKTLALAAVLSCFATVAAAQTAKPILGIVTEFKANAFEMGVKSDAGETVFVPFGTDTDVVQVAPGEHDLSKAAPVPVTGILPGDRVMVSFAAGMREARRIVLISSRDIATRNEAEKLDWKKRGISGIAVSQNGSEITLEIRTPQGTHHATVTVTESTKLRRYAPDSVKFSDAIGSTIAEIAPGDQVRARGVKNDDSSSIRAEEVVFGTFLTRMGPITAIRRETGEIQIQEVTTKKPLIIHVIAASQLKTMPDMRAMLTHGPAVPAPAQFDIQATMERLPLANFEDLKVGGSVIVTSTKGARSDAVTAILLLTNADFLVRMAQGQGSGETGMDAITRLHGGMLAGPTGMSLPTMIQ